ncbi:hypothetical protein OGAPHI_005049 [Ogataea philodendri]|uniref:Uncharacterized protein n=1 Tax=Ogataea philodendri TaxID=1378263 RepID=A0A9P8T298_9ASCO|nr:uncharacterized protein OGAPHI_005049 [Ogataea philodendri]KAH3663648.1 hypothetical protein OGAPHI_005049 [Ogataea philodendri]
MTCGKIRLADGFLNTPSSLNSLISNKDKISFLKTRTSMLRLLDRLKIWHKYLDSSRVGFDRWMCDPGSFGNWKDEGFWHHETNPCTIESASELFLMASSHQFFTNPLRTTSAGPEKESSANAFSELASVVLKTPSASLIKDEVRMVLIVKFLISSSKQTLSYVSGLLMTGNWNDSSTAKVSFSNPPRSGFGFGDHHRTMLACFNFLAYSMSII